MNIDKSEQPYIAIPSHNVIHHDRTYNNTNENIIKFM